MSESKSKSLISSSKSKKKLSIPKTKRKSYTHKNSTKVKPTSGVLKGYSASMPQNARRKTLSNLAKHHGSSLKVARDIQLLANYTKRSSPENYRKYKVDADYMFRMYEQEKERKSKSKGKSKDKTKSKSKGKSKEKSKLKTKGKGKRKKKTK